jgi:hypothetical protein
VALTQALSSLGDPQLLAPLLAELGRANTVHARLATISALGKLGAPGARASLQAELEEPLFERISPSTVGQLIRAAILQALAQLDAVPP